MTRIVRRSRVYAGLATFWIVCAAPETTTQAHYIWPSPPPIVQQVLASTVAESPEESVYLHPELVQICACESAGSKYKTPRQYVGGQVVRGHINPADIGMCQINEDYHGTRAKNMGLDIYTEEGNIAYANYLYEELGSKPWSASKSCWGQ